MDNWGPFSSFFFFDPVALLVSDFAVLGSRRVAYYVNGQNPQITHYVYNVMFDWLRDPHFNVKGQYTFGNN